MSGNSGKIEWYLARDGQQHGPLSAVELDKFIELGHLKPTDLLWRAGFDDWCTATEVFPPLPPQQVTPPPASPQMPAPPEPAGRAAATQAFQPERQAGAGPAARSRPVRHDEATQPIRKINVTGAPHDHRVADPAASEYVVGAGPTAHAGVPHDARRDPGSPSNAASPGAAAPARAGEAAADAAAASRRPVPATVDPAAQSNQVARATVAARSGDEFADEEFLEEEGSGRSGWLMVAAALFLFVLLGAGGLFAYNNQGDIAKLYADILGEVKPAGVAVVRAPSRVVREPASKPASQPVAPPEPAVGANVRQLNAQPSPPAAEKSLPELPILKSKLWQFAQKEMGSWTEERLAELAELDKSKEEANTYLVEAFVGFRRDNASHAMLASSGSLAEIATAFVTSLRALTQRGAESCYALIAKGETAPEISLLYMEPNIGPKLEDQMLTILKAIADGKASPQAKRLPPPRAAFEKLSVELGKRGWSAADLKLFSDPGALSKADPKLVCRLVTEWFATQTVLGDQVARDQLIAASLRPVIGG